MQQPHPISSLETLLEEAGILDAPNLILVRNHTNPKDMILALSKLHEVVMLTDVNRHAVATHPNPYSLARALYSLYQANILTAENRASMIAHPNPFLLASALINLHLAKILNAENQHILCQHHQLELLNNALCILERTGILIQPFFEAIVADANPRTLATRLVSLYTNEGIRIQRNYPQSIVMNDALLEGYLGMPSQLPASIRQLFIRQSVYDAREQALQAIIVFSLGKKYQTLSTDLMTYLYEFIKNDTSFRSLAMNIIKDIPLPKTPEQLGAYQASLELRIGQFKAHTLDVPQNLAFVP